MLYCYIQHNAPQAIVAAPLSNWLDVFTWSAGTPLRRSGTVHDVSCVIPGPEQDESCYMDADIHQDNFRPLNGYALGHRLSHLDARGDDANDGRTAVKPYALIM